ncbi:MAG: putative cyclic di-GMP phosphodiesterase PdeD [Candidatus Erwinia impunctatus]|nr:putative cyclic di-GMP phosphodiesterase PdeD [Culicoides impunctatus]
MPKSLAISGHFRRKRMLIAIIIAVLVLTFTLFLRFMEEKRRVEQHTSEFATKAIQRFDRLLSPLDLSGDKLAALSESNCSEVHESLVTEMARLQTLRSIILVKNNTMFCSSVFGTLNTSFTLNFPELATSGQQTMMLTTDYKLLKGSPVLVIWYPRAGSPDSGVLQIVNIEMMAAYILEPTFPWVERAVFNVQEKSLEYGNPLIQPAYPSEDEVEQRATSLRYPYSVTLFGPSSLRLALLTTPSQLPLALLLSLLIGYIAWLAIANRMSLAWQITHGINSNEFKVYCQPLINSQTSQCEGIEILLRWYS